MAMAMTIGSSSSSSATVAVDKATSDLLIGPDWTMNIDICDSVNSHRWQAKDVVKAVKRRLQHRSPKVQLLALTLLETMVKNCGDFVHFQIAEKNILGDMVKIVKKKADMHVRDKILVLLDSWQEAFGGPGGKYPQYYWAYEELRRSGVQFPQRSVDAAPIFTPPVTHSALRHTQAGYGMPSNSSRRLDETMASDIEGLTLSSLDSMRNVMELLSDMLHAVNPGDRGAVKDEIIVDLVDRCRSNQKMLMQMLTTTGDEELLGRGLELNDSLQILLAKHDAIASGSPMPAQITSYKPSEGISNSKSAEVSDSSPKHSPNPFVSVATPTKSQIDEDEEEEDDFAQLARRHSKAPSTPSQSSSSTGLSLVPVDSSNTTSTSTAPNTSLALALPDPPARTKEQDIIDLLSMTLSITPASSNNLHASQDPLTSGQSIPETPVSSTTQGYNTYGSQNYPGSQGQSPYNSYVVPWAQPQPNYQSQPPSQPQSQPQFQQPQSQSQLQPQPQQQLQSQFQTRLQPQSQQQFGSQSQAQLQHQFQPQLQSQYPQYSSAYPPPPWAATPGFANGQMSANNNQFTARANPTASNASMQASRPMQHNNSFPLRSSNGLAMNGNQLSSGPRNPTSSSGEKPFIPSYRLFEDLNVFGSSDGRYKMTSSTSPSLTGTSGQSMVGGRK